MVTIHNYGNYVRLLLTEVLFGMLLWGLCVIGGVNGGIVLLSGYYKREICGNCERVCILYEYF